MQALYRDWHVVMLAGVVLAELQLPLLDRHILQEVCITFAVWTLKAQLPEEGHHLSAAALCDTPNYHVCAVTRMSCSMSEYIVYRYVCVPHVHLSLSAKHLQQLTS